jgi:mono/diheme cytochrome c family protein
MIRLLSVALLALTLVGCETRTDDTATTTDRRVDDPAVTATADPVERGRHTYETFCASCHGLDGRGDGPVADALTDDLDDLRLLRQQHGGSFPVELIYGMIDGREDVRAHGTREMPVWGNVWTERDDQETVDRRISELVEFLRSIQIENEGAPETEPTTTNADAT